MEVALGDSAGTNRMGPAKSEENVEFLMGIWVPKGCQKGLAASSAKIWTNPQDFRRHQDANFDAN